MKKLLIIGGRGALGSTIIKTFKNNSPKWKIMNVDLGLNNDADHSYIIQHNLNKQDLIALSSEEFIKNKIDCIINVAGAWEGGTIGENDVIEKMDKMMCMNFYSSVLAANLANKHLNKNSLLVFTGAASVKDNLNPGMIGYHFSKQSVHHLTDFLQSSKDLVPENTKIITILPSTIDTKNNRLAMPDADFSKWTTTDSISLKLKDWADNKKYPEDIFYKV